MKHLPRNFDICKQKEIGAFHSFSENFQKNEMQETQLAPPILATLFNARAILVMRLWIHWSGLGHRGLGQEMPVWTPESLIQGFRNYVFFFLHQIMCYFLANYTAKILNYANCATLCNIFILCLNFLSQWACKSSLVLLLINTKLSIFT